MKLDKIKSQLNKIDLLLKSIQKGKEEISPVEKDLLLSYIRRLYELALLEKAPQKTNSSPKKKKKEPKVEEVMDIVDEPKKVAKKQVKEEQVEAPKDTPVDEITPKADTESQEEETQSPSLHIPEEVSELFTHKKAIELSEKLGESPIEDLNKAMGINEKIFTIQELFGGKQSFFDEAMKQLNSFSNFDDAKDYLIKNVAVINSWGEDRKKKKAENFIKLIRRRYK
jgi:hypothetical protein